MNFFNKLFFTKLTKQQVFLLIKDTYPVAKFIKDSWDFRLGERRFKTNEYLEVCEKCLDSDYYYPTKLAEEIEAKLLEVWEKKNERP